MGSFTHFFGVMAGQAIGIPLEPVPYRGAAPLGRRHAGRPYRGRLRRHHRFPRASPRRQGEGDLHFGREARNLGARYPDRRGARLSQAQHPGLVRLLRAAEDAAGVDRRLGMRVESRAGNARRSSGASPNSASMSRHRHRPNSASAWLPTSCAGSKSSTRSAISHRA